MEARLPIARWMNLKISRGCCCSTVDLCTLKPLNEQTVLGSVRKTSRLLVVHEASGLCGLAAELGALAVTRAFESPRAPVVRLTGPDAPAASSRALEQAAVPAVESVVESALGLVQWKGRGSPPA